jgi:hypothetical protein
MQEDQLYALEDYLEEYQRLVCKYRAENAALKRQLADNGISPANGTRPTNGRTQPMPAAPDMKVTPPANDATPPPDVDAPDIPPLESTTSANAKSNKRRRKTHGMVKQARAQAADLKSPPARAIALEPVDAGNVASAVWLHGEVVANETGGGPRLVVDVEPLDADGKVVEFNGALSLMLTASQEDGSKASIARWDYRPQELRSTAQPNIEGKLRFHLELPPETPTLSGAELWVQLLQRRRAKVLAHTKIELSKPSLFSSRTERGARRDLPSVTHDERVVTVTGEESIPDHRIVDAGLQPAASQVNSGVFDGGWTIARPGQPAGIADDNSQANSIWRASLEPPPSVMVSGVAAKPTPPVSRSQEPIASQSQTPAKTSKPSPWSPNRNTSSASSERTAFARPSWSATR